VSAYRVEGKNVEAEKEKCQDCVAVDTRKFKLRKEETQDREAWKREILGNHLTCVSMEK